MGRGGPAEPTLVEPGPSVDELLAIADAGGHAASDHLEDALLAGVRTVGCRRVGGGLAGEPADSNVGAGARLAAALPGADALILEGSGGAIPPVAADRTVCLVAPGEPEPLGRYRLLRADLVLAREGAPAPPGAVPFALRCEPAVPVPEDARVALFTTGASRCEGVEPVVASTNLGRRSALAGDLERAAAERCDLYLTELKAAAIDTVARRARERGAELGFVRNRPIGLDDALVKLWADA
jgi:cyclic 2,3-diphosphoglycerate synthetase